MLAHVCSVLVFSLLFLRLSQGYNETFLKILGDVAQENWLIFGYHRLAAQAYAACCGPVNASNLDVWKKWIDGYHSMNKQRQMIFECMHAVSTPTDLCLQDFQLTMNRYESLSR